MRYMDVNDTIVDIINVGIWIFELGCKPIMFAGHHCHGYGLLAVVFFGFLRKHTFLLSSISLK